MVAHAGNPLTPNLSTPGDGELTTVAPGIGEEENQPEHPSSLGKRAGGEGLFRFPVVESSEIFRKQIYRQAKR